ncbi:hypothetical protein JHK85_004969 [Glycine max]|nr:hypothetical protein JHK85_004969 [Glycine max]
MVVSIIKHLRDFDSIVRDISINMVALLASKLGREADSKEKVFVLLVKAVRYVVLQALKYWIILPAPPDTPNPSETGSSLKEVTPQILEVVEYRGVHVRPSVGDLREEKYCSEGKDCYHGMITCLI